MVFVLRPACPLGWPSRGGEPSSPPERCNLRWGPPNDTSLQKQSHLTSYVRLSLETLLVGPRQRSTHWRLVSATSGSPLVSAECRAWGGSFPPRERQLHCTHVTFRRKDICP